MHFPQEVVDRIISYLPRLSFQDLIVYSTLNKVWYLAAKKAYYNTLNITDSVRVDRLLHCLGNSDTKYMVMTIYIANRSHTNLPPIAQKPNCFRLFRSCVNVKKVDIWRVDPFFLLKCIRNANLTKLQEIRVHWPTLNHSTTVKELFYAANFAHKASIKSITMPPPKDANERIIFDYDGDHYNNTHQEYGEHFELDYYLPYRLYF